MFREKNTMWMFRVSDNGPGIEEKYHDTIFQTLAPRNASEDAGIGLALVKRIVQMIGGRI